MKLCPAGLVLVRGDSFPWAGDGLDSRPGSREDAGPTAISATVAVEDSCSQPTHSMLRPHTLFALPAPLDG